ncbi:MAG: leucine-rich repeat domain-containing protein [bacterium]
MKDSELSTVANVFTVEDFYEDKEMERNPKNPAAALRRAKNYTSSWGIIYFLREAPAAYPGKGYETIIPLYWETFQKTGDAKKATDIVLQNLKMHTFLSDFKDYFLSFEEEYIRREKRRHKTDPICDCEYCEYLRRTNQTYPPELLLGAESSASERTPAAGSAKPRSTKLKTQKEEAADPQASDAVTQRPANRDKWTTAIGAFVLACLLIAGVRYYKGRKLFMLAALLSAGPLFGEVATTNGYTFIYRVAGNMAEIFNDATCAVMPQPEGALSIPSTLDGYPVTAIGDGAFDRCAKLASVKIPDSVTAIGEGAFFQCSSLKSVEIPTSVTAIRDWTFSRSFRLDSVTIGNSVSTIGSEAFSGCTGLTSLKIPDSVTAIGDRAFKWCSGLNAMTIPDSVTAIGQEVFAGCSSLAAVTIPGSVTAIGSGAFEWCSALTTVKLTDSVTTIGDHAFYGCYRLTAVKMPDSVTTVGRCAFAGCYALDDAELGDSVTFIGSFAFYECYGLTSVALPDCVTTISDSAFFRCARLLSVMIPDTVTAIGERVFRECTSLTSVRIPPSMQIIGAGAFEKCESLTSVTLPDSVTAIRDSAFAGCSRLRKAVIGNAVSKIGKRAFADCSSLLDVTIPDSATSIGSRAFEGCSRLTSVTYAGNAPPSVGTAIYDFTPDTLTSYIMPGSKGWGDTIPGLWKERPVRYQVTKSMIE